MKPVSSALDRTISRGPHVCAPNKMPAAELKKREYVQSFHSL